MDCSTPGFPVHHQLLKPVQSYVHESVMPSNHLILCRPLLLLPSIFSSIRVFSNESVLHNRLPNYWRLSISSSNEIQDWSPLELTGLISLLSKGLSRVFSNATFQKHQFFGAQLSLWSTLTSINDYWKNHSFDGPFSAKSCLCFLICCLGSSCLFFQEASIF